jgi:hypothetical protein
MIRAGRFRIAIKYPAESSIEASAARGTCENKFRKRHAVSVTTPSSWPGIPFFGMTTASQRVEQSASRDQHPAARS